MGTEVAITYSWLLEQAVAHRVRLQVFAIPNQNIVFLQFHQCFKLIFALIFLNIYGNFTILIRPYIDCYARISATSVIVGNDLDLILCVGSQVPNFNLRSIRRRVSL